MDQRPEWHLRARCAFIDNPRLFDDSKDVINGLATEQRVSAARRVCIECPVIVECATWAYTRREPSEVWAGATTAQRGHFMHQHRGDLDKVITATVRRLHKIVAAEMGEADAVADPDQDQVA